MGNSRISSSLSLTAVTVIFCCWVLSTAGAALSGRCKFKVHSHKAVQTDMDGRRCWDDVRIKTCWGYCQSYEISDWQFPYKQSNHPVCVHGERKHASVKLRNCDPGVQPGTDIYHYVEAVSCKCQKCSSEDTSCEWLPPDYSLLDELVLRDDIEEEIDDAL